METCKGNVLFAHADEEVRDELPPRIRANQFFVQNAKTVDELRRATRVGRFDFILVDFQLCRRDFETLFPTILQANASAVIIVVCTDDVYPPTEKYMLDHGAREVIKPDELELLLRVLGILPSLSCA